MQTDFEFLSIQASTTLSQEKIDLLTVNPDKEGDVLQTSFMDLSPNAKSAWQTTGIAPVPEPATILMTLGGLVTIAVKKIRRNG